MAYEATQMFVATSPEITGAILEGIGYGLSGIDPLNNSYGSPLSTIVSVSIFIANNKDPILEGLSETVDLIGDFVAKNKRINDDSEVRTNDNTYFEKPLLPLLERKRYSNKKTYLDRNFSY